MRSPLCAMNPRRDKIVQLIHFQKEITIRLHIELVEKINSTGTTDYLKIAMVLLADRQKLLSGIFPLFV